VAELARRIQKPEVRIQNSEARMEEAVLVELTKREIKLMRQQQALRAATGAWKAEDHPELAGGAASWVREIRQESVKRFEKIQRHRKGK
jgi:hypothetical protein